MMLNPLHEEGRPEHTAANAIASVLDAPAKVLNEDGNMIRSSVLVKEMFSPTCDAVVTVRHRDGSRGFFLETETRCVRVRTKSREEMLEVFPPSLGACVMIRRRNGSCEAFLEGHMARKSRARPQ
ncbi:MAG: hypothetical protein LLG06_16180 [Desulfobacteraceae bacterium]|nr:hypothetical protein [Desulfobacteraceae bacterium]